MKFNTENKPNFPDNGLAIGNVYRCKGGANSDQKFWIVVGLPRDRVVMLGIDNEGNIVSSGNYGQHVFDCSSQWFQRGREIVGRCKDMSAICFNVQWEALV